MAKNEKPGLGGKKLTPEFAGGTTGEARALQKLLLQNSKGNVLAGIIGDNARGVGIAQAEAKLLDSRGAVVIDCENLNARELIFGGETLPDGFKEGLGPLARAIDAGQPVILENFMKIKRGTTDSLQSLFALLSGDLKEVTFESPLGDEPYKVSRRDLGPNFRLRVTGVEGYEDAPSASLNSRISFVNPDEAVLLPTSMRTRSPEKK